jgi:hypothetical protein
MHAYRRSLTSAGRMNLNYLRVLNGEVLRAVTGTLERAK